MPLAHENFTLRLLKMEISEIQRNTQVFSKIFSICRKPEDVNNIDAENHHNFKFSKTHNLLFKLSTYAAKTEISRDCQKIIKKRMILL